MQMNETPKSLYGELLNTTDLDSIVQIINKNIAILNDKARSNREVVRKSFGIIDSNSLCKRLVSILLQSRSEARAAVFRLLRYIFDDSLAKLIVKHNIDYLIARALLVDWDEIEHREALKLTSYWILESQMSPPRSIAMMLLTLVESCSHKQQFYFVHLRLLCLIISTHPIFAVDIGIIPVLLDRMYCNLNNSFSLKTVLPSILCGLEQMPLGIFPEANLIGLIISPILEHTYPNRITATTGDGLMKSKEEVQFICQKAMKICLKCWAGKFYMFYGGISAVSSLCGALFCGNSDDELFVLKVIYEIFDLDYPNECKTLHEILRAREKRGAELFNEELTDSGEGGYGFVAGAVDREVLPISRKRPKLNDCDDAYLCLIFLKSGIVEACLKMVLRGAYELFLPANYLLAEFMHLCIRLLPQKFNFIFLPKLISDGMMSSYGLRRERSIKFVSNLSVLFKRKETNQYCTYLETLKARYLEPISADNQFKSGKKQHSSITSPVLVDSGTLEKFALRAYKANMGQENPCLWDWMKIYEMLKTCHMEKSIRPTHAELFSKILAFFRLDAPSGFRNMPIEDPKAVVCYNCGIKLMDVFIECGYREFLVRLKTFVQEIEFELKKVVEQLKSEDDCSSNPFTSENLKRYCSQYYFLMIGQLSRSKRGCILINGIFDILIKMIEVNGTYSQIILALSTLDYSNDAKTSKTRYFFELCLKSNRNELRLYSTAMIRLFLRFSPGSFQDWPLSLLINSLTDNHSEVQKVALDIFDEACQLEGMCESISRKVSIGQLMMTAYTKLCIVRLFSSELVFQKFKAQGILQRILDDWESNMCLEYVRLMESRMIRCRNTADSIMLPHLYGELSKHANGMDVIRSNAYFLKAINQLKNFEQIDNIERLKEYLWIMGNVAGGSTSGIELLIDHNIIPSILRIITQSSFISVRATGFYVNNAISLTYRGGIELRKRGWSFCMRDESFSSPLHLEYIREVHENLLDESFAEGAIWDEYSANANKVQFDFKKPKFDSGLDSIDSLGDLNYFGFDKGDNCKKSVILEQRYPLSHSDIYCGNETLAEPNEFTPMKESKLLTVMHLARYNEYREIVGQYSHNVFSLWKNDESDDEDVEESEDEFEKVTVTMSPNGVNETEFLMGICVPVSFKTIIDHPATVQMVEDWSVNVKRNLFQGALNKTDTDYKYVKKLANFFLTGVHRKRFENLLLKHKYKNPQVYRDVGLFIDLCELISRIRNSVYQKEILFDLFIDLNHEEFTEVQIRDSEPT